MVAHATVDTYMSRMSEGFWRHYEAALDAVSVAPYPIHPLPGSWSGICWKYQSILDNSGVGGDYPVR